MMNEFDIKTLLLFIMIGTIGKNIISKYVNNASCSILKERSNKNSVIRINLHTFLWTISFYLLFVFFAVFRKVGDGTGGSDAQGYIRFFITCLETNDSSFCREPLWIVFTRGIRYFTDNYHIYFWIIYSIILYSIIRFMREYCPDNIDFTPMILVTWFYIKDFNTIRSGVAVSCILLGVVSIKKHYIRSLVYFSVAVFFHRMSIIYSVFIIFYFLYRRNIKKIYGFRLVLFYVTYIVASYCIALNLQSFIISKGLMKGVDDYYIRMSLGQNIFLRWPMYIGQLVLLLGIICLSKDLDDSENMNVIKLMCTFDFLMVPASITLGMWRANEYFFPARLIMWGELLRIVSIKFKIDKKVVTVIAGMLFIAWFVFRLYQESSEIGVMPYIISLKNKWS